MGAEATHSPILILIPMLQDGSKAAQDGKRRHEDSFIPVLIRMDRQYHIRGAAWKSGEAVSQPCLQSMRVQSPGTSYWRPTDIYREIVPFYHIRYLCPPMTWSSRYHEFPISWL